ncbi:MAG: histidine--tRNA ligase [Planctomycetaceae bacterium]
MRIKPRTLKGFRDYLPAQMLPREALMQTAREVYRSYGFAPIDTPALEYAEVLLGKGSDETDKQLFRFQDGGDRDVAMRFDLTIPFARFSAQHLQEIGTPFKRYAMGTVWRGEKPQKGRYREFIQCDFDTIGTKSNAADIETLFVINDLIETIGFEKFTIRVNNRMVLNGVLEQLQIADRSTDVLRALDKLLKIGEEKVIAEMVENGIAEEPAKKVLQFAALSGTPEEMLSGVEAMVADSESGQEGIAKLRELFEACKAAGLKEDRVQLDLSIARGLDYYTGTIYETFLDDLPTIGSVCSGGRYDNLAELFTSQQLPGVGASLGLDRLLAAMEELGMLPETKTPAPVLVTMFDKERTTDYLRLGRLLRQAGISTEVYPDAKQLKKQLKYADQKGFRVAIIAGKDEFKEGVWQVKDLVKKDQATVVEKDRLPTVQSPLDA